MTAIKLAPGVHYDVPFTDYLAWRAMSQSVLKHGRASMAHLKAAWDGAVSPKITDAMLVGQALHVCFLEPDGADDRIVLWTEGARRGKDWTAFCAANAGRIILTENMHARVCGAVAALRRHPVVREWVEKIEGVEVSALGEFAGLPFKARTDARTSDPLVDLKLTRSCDPATFTRTVLSFGYYMQGAIYRELFNRDRFMLIAVEDRAPFDVIAYELAPSMLRHGEREARLLVNEWKQCESRQCWPGRSDEPVTLELPDWIADQSPSTVTIGGAAAFDEEEIF